MANDKPMRSAQYKTPPGVLSFPELFKKNKDGKFQASLIWPAGTDLSVIEQAIEEAGVAKWGKDWKAKQGKKIKYPLHSNTDGCRASDGERYAGYEDDEGFYAAFRTTSLPNVIGSTKDADGKWVRLSQEEIWAGCLCRFSFYALAGVDADGGNYMSLRLDNVQLLREGEAISGGFTPEPEDDFSDDPDVLAALGEAVA